jgi:hypothetical protein
LYEKADVPFNSEASILPQPPLLPALTLDAASFRSAHDLHQLHALLPPLVHSLPAVEWRRALTESMAMTAGGGGSKVKYHYSAGVEEVDFPNKKDAL